MTQLHKRRLLKLAKFLREKVPDEHFNFRVVTRLPNGCGSSVFLEILSGQRNGCGAAACAIGWMPAVFPSLVKWTKYGGVKLRDGHSLDGSFAVVGPVFGLSHSEAGFLFLPTRYPNQDDTTRHEVAERIEAFANRGVMPKSKR